MIAVDHLRERVEGIVTNMEDPARGIVIGRVTCRPWKPKPPESWSIPFEVLAKECGLAVPFNEARNIVEMYLERR